jgi:hypothetical protein
MVATQSGVGVSPHANGIRVAKRRVQRIVVDLQIMLNLRARLALRTERASTGAAR